MSIVYQHGSSHISSGAVRWCYQMWSWPEVASPEVALAGIDVQKVTWPKVIACTCATGSRAFLLTIVVQNVSLCITDMVTGCDVIKRNVTPKGFLGRVRACATESCAIDTPIGTFSPEVTSSNVTWSRRASFGTESHVIGSALGVLSRTSGSYSLIIFYELALSLIICPFPAILFTLRAPSIITQPFFKGVFGYVFHHVRVLVVVFLLNNLRVKWMQR
jgi:hypothetical protein